MEQAAEALAAAVGGIFSAGVLYPLQVIKTVLQSKSKETGTDKGAATAEHSVKSVTHEVYARSGLLGFYSGVEYSALESALEKAAYFYSYSWLRRLALAAGLRSINTPTDLALGYMAEASHLPLTLPIELVLARLMTARTSTSAKAVVQGILTESGWQGLYHGLSTYYVLCLKPAVQYAVFNQLKAAVLAYRSGKANRVVTTLTAAEAFLLGAVARAVATIAVFPFMRVKVLMMTAKSPTPAAAAATASSSEVSTAKRTAGKSYSQAVTGGSSSSSSSSGAVHDEEADTSTNVQQQLSTEQTLSSSSSSSSSSHSMLASVMSIARSEGAGALFRGLGPELTRGVLSAALMLMVKERAGAGALRVVQSAAKRAAAFKR